MYLGKIVELSPAEELYTRPIMPYTEALLSAVPIPDPDLRRAARADRARGRRPEPDQPADRLPLPSALPLCDRRLQARSSRRSSTTATVISPPATTRLNVDQETLQRVRSRERHTPAAADEDAMPQAPGNGVRPANPWIGVATRAKAAWPCGRYPRRGRCGAQGDPQPLRGPSAPLRERLPRGAQNGTPRSSRSGPAPRARAGADDAGGRGAAAHLRRAREPRDRAAAVPVEETVKSHVRHLLAKLQARSRAHAVAVGFRRGIIG